jgi:hypothetical protein
MRPSLRRGSECLRRLCDLSRPHLPPRQGCDRPGAFLLATDGTFAPLEVFSIALGSDFLGDLIGAIFGSGYRGRATVSRSPIGPLGSMKATIFQMTARGPRPLARSLVIPMTPCVMPRSISSRVRSSLAPTPSWSRCWRKVTLPPCKG